MAPVRLSSATFSRKILSVNSGEASWPDESRLRVLAALQLETMAQLGLCIGSFVRRASVDVPLDLTPDNVRALKVHSAIFLSEILPGDDITILTKLVESDGYGALCAGQLMKGDAVASLVVMEVYLVEG